jgi:MFS transporter, DHA2 family, multidrug resistance protein
MSSSRDSAGINPWLIAAAVILPTFMEVLDTTIVSVALPHIAGSLSASVEESTWVQTSYLISNAIVLPASAWFSGLFGRKRFLLTCIAIFTAASALCGMSFSLGFLVLARVVQGAGGGALQPLSQAILLESFPKEKHGQAMAVFAFGVIVAPVVGPILGGWITDNATWRWAFYLNLPIGLAALWMVRRFVRDPDYVRNAKVGRIDAIGFALLSLWLGTLQTVLDKGQDDDWFSAEWIRWFAAVSALAFVAFVIRQLRTREPIADLRVFRNRNFAVGAALMAAAGVIVYSPLTLLPLFLQGPLDFSALQSGLAQAPRGLGVLLIMPLVGALVGRVDVRKLIGTGFLIAAGSTAMLANISLAMGPHQVDFPNLLQGFGVALITVPLLTTSVGTLAKEEIGNASGLLNLMRNLGASVGISMVTTMVSRGAQAQQAMLAHDFAPGSGALASAIAGARAALTPSMGSVQAASAAPALIYRELLGQSGVLAYIRDFQWLALLCVAVVPLVLLFQKVRATGPVMAH